MSVQTSNVSRFAVGKPAGVYLMELRRRLAEVNSRQQKLTVISWSRAESQIVPIQRRSVLPERTRS